MTKLRWPNKKEEHAYLRMRQIQNLRRAMSNRNENWMHNKLVKTGHKWTRQAIWGYRLFDFWCAELGIAVEVDGPEHRKVYDSIRDKYNRERSGIIVLRVRNKNEEDAAKALNTILLAETWAERRKKGLRKSERTHHHIKSHSNPAPFSHEWLLQETGRGKLLERTL